MTTLLAYFPSPPRGVWHLGPLPIRAYALFIIVGIVVALLIGDRRWAARGGERGVIYDIALWAVPFGLIGGRLYHLATDWRTYWGPGGAGFGAALRIWDGGLGIWGAVALGGVGAWIGCRRRGIPLPAFGDALAPGIVLAQAVGRLGNYFNQELYGRETTLPWGLKIFDRRDPSGYVDPHLLDGVSTGQVRLVVHPTFLYELIWNVLVFVALIYVDRRFKLGHGRLFALYVAGYCIGRFGVELLRDDTATLIAGIRINVFTSTFVFIGAVVYMILAPKGREDPASLHGADYVAEEAPEPEPETEAITGASAAAAAAMAGALAAGRTAKRLIPRKRSRPAASDDEAAEAETVKAASAVPEPEAEEAEVEAEEPTAQIDEAEADELDAGADEADAEEPEAEAEEPEAEEDEAEGAEPEAEMVEPEADEAEAEEAEAEAEEAEVAQPEADAEVEEPEEAESGETASGADEPEAAEPEAEVEEPEEEAEAAEEEEPEAEAEEAEVEEPADEEAADEDAADEESEVAEAEAAVAEDVESEAAEPEVAEPEAEVEEPEEEAEAAEEEEPEAEAEEAEVEEPAESEAADEEAADEEPEVAEAQAAVAEDVENEAAEPEAAETEAVATEAAEAEAAEPEAAELEESEAATTSDTAGSTRRRFSFRLRNRGNR